MHQGRLHGIAQLDREGSTRPARSARWAPTSTCRSGPARESPTFPGCTGFTPDGADLYSGTLANFGSTYTSWANGLLDAGPGAASSWVNGNSVVYRFTLTLQAGAPDAAQNTSTGSHAFTWEARNT